MQKLRGVKHTHRGTFPQLDLTYMSITIFHHRTQQRIFGKDAHNFILTFIYT